MVLYFFSASLCHDSLFFFFFFNDTATTEIYTLSLHDALPIWPAIWLPRLKRALREPLRSRALHVVGETARTRFGAQLLARGRLRQFGQLLYEAHESCRRLYECSAPELDCVVAAAKCAGALGARLTGAGWGGAALVLVEPRRAAGIAAAIRRAFVEAFGREPGITRVEASGGMHKESVK